MNDRIANITASLLIALPVGGIVAITGGPLWAAIGFALTTYFVIL